MKNAFRWADHVQHLPYMKDLVMNANLNFETIKVDKTEKEEEKELTNAQKKKQQKAQWLKDNKDPDKRKQEITPEEIEKRR